MAKNEYKRNVNERKNAKEWSADKNDECQHKNHPFFAVRIPSSFISIKMIEWWAQYTDLALFCCWWSNPISVYAPNLFERRSRQMIALINPCLLFQEHKALDQSRRKHVGFAIETNTKANWLNEKIICVHFFFRSVFFLLVANGIINLKLIVPEIVQK